MMAHCRLTFSLAATAEGPLVASLWDAGTTGLEVREDHPGRLEVEAFFGAPPPLPPAALEPGGDYWGVAECELVGVDRIEDSDWLARYRETATPQSVGRLLTVDPGEPDGNESCPPVRDRTTGRFLLRLPARRAFGTGSHESTRLAIRLLERDAPEDLSVLDVGCGTGILSFAALLLGARSVTAVEIDPEAAHIASQNQRLNGLFFAIAAGAPRCLKRGGRFDLALVNVVPEAIRPELPAIAELVRVGGRAVFSGLLAEQAPRLTERLQRLGFEPLDEAVENEWMAIRVERRRAG